MILGHCRENGKLSTLEPPVSRVTSPVGSGTGAVARQDAGLAVSWVSPFVPV